MGARQNETSLSGFPASEVVQTRRQMEVDGFDRALERCLPVDDVDAMDEASSAGVEKVSLQRTRPPRPRGTRTPRAPASACSVAIFTVDVPTYKQGAHGFCETFEPIASYFSQHAVDSRRAPLRQPVIGAIDSLPWPCILASADRVRSLAHGEAEACARTPPILPSSSNSPR